MVNDNSNKNNGKRNGLIAVAIAGGILGTCIYGFQYYSSTHAVQTKDRTIELGTKTDLLFDAKDWVKSGEDYSELSVAIMQKDKMKREYLEVGTYDVKLVDSNNNQKGSATLTIEDTTIPEWDKTTDEIALTVGDKLKLKDYFHANDLAKLKYKTKDKIDTSKSGETTTFVLAEDTSGNYNQHECKFIIKDNEESVSGTQSEENASNESANSNNSSKSQSSTNTSNGNQQSSSNAIESSSSTATQNHQSQSTQQQQAQQSTQTTQNSQTQTTTQENATQPEAPATPVCEAVPAGAYTDYSTANQAAQAALDAVSDANGWSNSYYKINYGWTNCGTPYYTFIIGQR